jgi:hypothetical protein
MLEVNIYKSKRTISNAKRWCIGKGLSWEHQGYGIDSHTLYFETCSCCAAALYFETFQMVFGDLWDLLWLILFGCVCGDTISVEIVLKWH